MEQLVDRPMGKMLFVGMLLLTSVAGCATVRNVGTASVMRLRVERAWLHSSIVAKSSAHPRHFTRGWKKGYYSVANGGDGVLPAVPPKHYWSVLYQSAKGRDQVAAWFDGYGQGAADAEADGVKSLNEIPTAWELAAGDGPSQDDYSEEDDTEDVHIENESSSEEAPSQPSLDPSDLDLLDIENTSSLLDASKQAEPADAKTVRSVEPDMQRPANPARTIKAETVDSQSMLVYSASYVPKSAVLVAPLPDFQLAGVILKSDPELTDLKLSESVTSDAVVIKAEWSKKTPKEEALAVQSESPPPLDALPAPVQSLPVAEPANETATEQGGATESTAESDDANNPAVALAPQRTRERVSAFRRE